MCNLRHIIRPIFRLLLKSDKKYLPQGYLAIAIDNNLVWALDDNLTIAIKI